MRAGCGASHSALTTQKYVRQAGKPFHYGGRGLDYKTSPEKRFGLLSHEVALYSQTLDFRAFEEYGFTCGRQKAKAQIPGKTCGKNRRGR